MTMDSINLRKFDWGDLESVARLFTSISGAGGTEKEASLDLVRQTLSHPSVHPETNLTLALSDSDLIGYYQLYPEEPISRAVVAGGVLEEFRGRGIGRRLLSTAIEQVEALDVSVLNIQTAADAADARHLLESVGFQVKEQRINTVQVPLEGWINISEFEDWIRGVMPGVPLREASEALKQGAREVFEDMNVTHIPRNWLEIVASRP